VWDWGCFDCWFCFDCGGRVSPRRAASFLARARKEAKNTAPRLRPLRWREGADLWRRACGVGRITHCAAAQLRSDNCGQSVHEAWAHLRPYHPASAPPQAQPQGAKTGRGRRCARPFLLPRPRQGERAGVKGQWFGRCACTSPPTLTPALSRPAGEGVKTMRRGGVGQTCSPAIGCLAVPSPHPPSKAAPVSGRWRGGMGAGAPMLRELTGRICPNEAAQQRSELCGPPRQCPETGCPHARQRVGDAACGARFFAYFLVV